HRLAPYRSAWFVSAAGRRKLLLDEPMPALPPKADMCGAARDVRFGPKADIVRHSITSSARPSKVVRMAIPRALAILRLMISSNVVGRAIGRSPGFSPFNTRPA